jgi:hypothetical protein
VKPLARSQLSVKLFPALLKEDLGAVLDKEFSRYADLLKPTVLSPPWEFNREDRAARRIARLLRLVRENIPIISYEHTDSGYLDQGHTPEEADRLAKIYREEARHRVSLGYNHLTEEEQQLVMDLCLGETIEVVP